LPFTGLGGLWDTNHASQLLLTWVALTILFLNAVYQDGVGDDLPPRWVRRGVEGALLAMAVYVAIAAYGLSLRIGQYGLTPERFWGVLATAVLGAYAFGYALAVLRRGEPWLRMVRAVNLVVALFVAAIGLLAHTPVLDPIGWSARSQFKRLAGGRIPAAEFDYGYLQFELGRAGVARLAELETLESHPEFLDICERVALVRAEENYWRWKQRHGAGFGPDLFEVLPAGATLPEGLIDFARSENLVWTEDSCGAKRYCAAIQVELDGEAPKEWVLVVHRRSWAQALAIAETDTGFRSLGVLQPVEGGAKPTELEASLKASDFGTEAPRFRDFRIGDARYRVVPN
ncbi:MAG: DUF4153 domain-containing protein, partial [Deltaproteobacteria bacterium]|nr:DUF4153 domain-containing protein [Deltaproteobacteria bacterium]